MSRSKALGLFKGPFEAEGAYIQDADGRPVGGIMIHYMTLDKAGITDTNERMELEHALAQICAAALTNEWNKLKKEEP